jgi:hypothetical protein
LPAITDFGASLPLVTAAFFSFAALELVGADAVPRQAGGDRGAAEGDEQGDRRDHVRVAEVGAKTGTHGVLLLSSLFSRHSRLWG